MSQQEVKQRILKRLNANEFVEDVSKIQEQISKPGMEENSFFEPISPTMYQKPVLFCGKNVLSVPAEGITSVSRIARR